MNAFNPKKEQKRQSGWDAITHTAFSFRFTKAPQ